MRLLLIRHGETADNVERVVGTRLPGPALSRVGEHQARRLASTLAAEGIRAVSSSHARRAIQTATALADGLGVPRFEVEGLHEIDAGDFEGRPYAEAMAGYRGTMLTWWDHPGSRISGGENGTEFLARFDAAVSEVLAHSPANSTAALVSHEAAICVWAASTATNLDAEFSRTHDLSNTGVVALEGSPAAGWTATSWGGIRLTR